MLSGRFFMLLNEFCNFVNNKENKLYKYGKLQNRF